MEVILLENVLNLGKIGAKVTVKTDTPETFFFKKEVRH